MLHKIVLPLVWLTFAGMGTQLQKATESGQSAYNSIANQDPHTELPRSKALLAILLSKAAVSSRSLLQIIKPAAAIEKKKGFKVCICGGSGGIGQPLSLLMAMDPNTDELSVIDITMAMVPPAGVAAELGHLDKKTVVKGYAKGLDDKAIDVLEEALTGCDLVLVSSGMPYKPGQSPDDLFRINAGIAKEVCEATAAYCPNAIVGIITNPVNSIVPAMAELYRKRLLDPQKIVGVTSLDVVRANTFVGEITGADPSDINVPVIGGHSGGRGVTTVPVFSQDKFAKTIPNASVPALHKRVQEAAMDVVNAKKGKGSATLSMAYAGAKFGKAVLAGLRGTPTTECAYVMSDAAPGLPYFSSKVTFGRSGVQKVHPIGKLTEYEEERLEQAKVELAKEIMLGLDYAAKSTLAFPKPDDEPYD